MKKTECTPEQWAEQLAKWRDWHRENDKPADKQRKAEWLKRDRAANPEKYRAKSRAWYAKNKERDRAKWQERSARQRRRNPDRQREYARRWQEAHPEKVKEKLKRRHLRAYGLTLEGYQEMRDAQSNACAICVVAFSAEPRGPRSIHVDHCHRTNVVRGLLCNSCNNGLGRFRDNPESLRSAADYVEKHRAK